MSLTTGFTTATGAPPRAEPGSQAPSGRATATAAAFAAVAQDLADGPVSGAGAPGEQAASTNPNAAPAHAGATAGTVNEPAAPTGNRGGSWDVLGQSLVGWYFFEQQQQPPAQMVDGNAALAGASPAPGSGHDAASGAAGSEGSAAGEEPVLSDLSSGQTGAVPAGASAGSAVSAVPSNPNSGAPVLAHASPTAAEAEKAPSAAPVAKTPGEQLLQPLPSAIVTAQSAGAGATPAPATPPPAAPAAPRLADSGTANGSLPAPLPEGGMPGNRVSGTGAGAGITEPAVKISAPGTNVSPAAPMPEGGMPGSPATVAGTSEHAVKISGTFVPPAAPMPGGTIPGNRASGAGTSAGTTEPAVKISAPGTFVPPAAPALPGESALPAAPALPGHAVLPAAAAVPASPVMPGAVPVPPVTGPAAPVTAPAGPVTVPQTAGGTAGMAPVSAAAASGFAGLEVSAKDGSAVQPPVAPAPMAAPVAPASPSSVPVAGHTPAAAPAQQLLNQVSQPLVRIASAGPGEHVMTLSVNPENLGPVTVRAVISSDGVRVEMFAPTDTAREALRHILAELRRDLAGASTGPAATLTLSDQNSPGNGSNGGAAHADDRSGRTPAPASGEPANPSAAAGRPEISPQRSGPTGATTALDVMA